jgi:hypothetical protein
MGDVYPKFKVASVQAASVYLSREETALKGLFAHSRGRFKRCQNNCFSRGVFTRAPLLALFLSCSGARVENLKLLRLIDNGSIEAGLLRRLNLGADKSTDALIVINKNFAPRPITLSAPLLIQSKSPSRSLPLAYLKCKPKFTPEKKGILHYVTNSCIIPI